jgi:hypothetical protein
MAHDTLGTVGVGAQLGMWIFLGSESLPLLYLIG